MNDEDVLAWLKDHGSPAVLADMSPKYGIHTSNAFGVSMADMKMLAKQLGKNHELAERLWDSGCYEGRMVASMIDEPAAVTPQQMDRWCRDFDNWAICDTVCFNFFDRTPHAWTMVEQWSGDPGEFVKRAAFALLWSIALHDKKVEDEKFVHGLMLIEREAHDDRHLVSKSMLMAVRAIAKRSPMLKTAAVEMTQRLTVSQYTVSRRLGKTALRELSRFGAPPLRRMATADPHRVSR